MESLIGWFKSLDWLANALAVLTPLGGIGIFAWKWRRKRAQLPKSFTALVATITKPPLIAETLKRVGQIAIIDDSINDFPVAELKKAGYNIKTYKHVGVSEFDEISKYDVVFLDMLDIVKDDPTEGGLKLIGTLRRKNPRQRICAVSSKKFDPSATAFFKQADDAQNKPMSAQKCVQVIDTFLAEKLDPRVLADELDRATDLQSSDKSTLLTRINHSAVKKVPLDLDTLPNTVRALPRSIAFDLSRVLAA